MELKLYEVKIRLYSPAIITRRRTERGYASFTTHIPSSSLRGAVLSSLHWHGIITEERLKEEATRPTLIASPAYPYIEQLKSYPSHPFIAKCKKPNCKAIFNYLPKALDALLKGKVNEVFKARCGQGHPALEHLHPSPIVFKDERIEEVKVLAGRSISTAISKRRGAGIKGMIYNYEAIGSGSEFWATLSIPEDIKFGGELRLWIGRGKSRGFGEAALSIIKEVNLEEEAKVIASSLKEWNIPFYASSPLLEASGNVYAPYPEEVDLDPLSRFIGFKPEARLTVNQVIGKTEQHFWLGYDMVENRSRPMVEAMQQGSVLLATPTYSSKEKLSLALAALKYFGTIEEVAGFVISGLNMISPLETHPIYKWGT